MDFAAIGAITSSITSATDIAKGLISARDQANIQEKTATLLEQLLKAQESLLAHNAALLQLQHQHFEAREELRKLHEAASERSRYSLVEVTRGCFAYRVNITPQQSGASEPATTEPVHYLCQPCFDKGVKSVLMSAQCTMTGGSVLKCVVCKTSIGVKPGFWDDQP